MSAEALAQIDHCRHLLERGEQAVRDEAWDALPGLQRSYEEAIEGLRVVLGEGPLDDDGLRERVAELDRRQRQLIYEFRKGQMIVKARMEDMQFARARLERRFGSDIPLFISASVDRSV